MSDRSARGDEFDPRFNPAFQPGYDPERHRNIPSVEKDGRAPLLGAPEVIEPTAQPVLRVPEAASVSSVSPAAIDFVEQIAASPDNSAVEQPARHVNKYLIALWVISVLFIAAGITVVRQIGLRLDALNVAGGGSGFDYYLLQVYTTAAPLLVLLGLATAVGTLFVLAATRAHR